MPRLGRPREFTHRERMTLLLDRDELRALQVLADQAGTSVSAYVRRLVQRAVAKGGSHVRHR